MGVRGDPRRLLLHLVILQIFISVSLCELSITCSAAQGDISAIFSCSSRMHGYESGGIHLTVQSIAPRGRAKSATVTQTVEEAAQSCSTGIHS